MGVAPGWSPGATIGNQMDPTNQFWLGLLLGFVLGVVGNILASHIWELRARSRAYNNAMALVGTWKAFNIHGRNLEPMAGAGDTTISAKGHRWSATSNVLEVRGVDKNPDGDRHHSGPLVIDPICDRIATRIMIYEFPTPDEATEQRIVISYDRKTLYVFPVRATLGLPSYTPSHALCKVEDALTGRPVS